MEGQLSAGSALECAWMASDNGHAKAMQQQSLSLYVHPEPSPEIDERIARDTGFNASLQQLDVGSSHHVDRTNQSHTTNTFHSGYALYANAYRDGSFDCFDGCPSGPNGSGMSGACCSGAESNPLAEPSCKPAAGAHSAYDAHDHEMAVDGACGARQLPSDGAPGALPRPDVPSSPASQRPSQVPPPQPDQAPASTPCFLATPLATAAGDLTLTGCVGTLRPEAGRFKSASGAPPSDTPGANGELLTARSLSLSAADRDLLDQLLGAEACGASPQLVTPSSFMAPGPFANPGMQSVLSDLCQRPTSGQLSDVLDGEADSDRAGKRCAGLQQQQQQPQQQHPPLVSAYSEPLPFSAAAQQRRTFHPGAPSRGLDSAPGKASAPGLPGQRQSSHGGAAPAAGNGDLPAASSRPGSGPCGLPYSAGQDSRACDAGKHPQPQQLPQLQPGPAHAGAGCPQPHRLPASMPSSAPDEPGLLPPSYSAPVPGPPGRQQGSCGGASSPMRVDGPGGCSMSYASASAGGAAAFSAGSTLEPGGDARPTAAGNGAVTATAVVTAPTQQSPSDSRGKRLRPQTYDNPTLAPSGPAPAAASGTVTAAGGPAGGHAASQPHPQPAGPTAAAAGSRRPVSPDSRTHSMGDPMSVSMEGGEPMYGHGYPYPYGMATPYGMPYSMPYGDLYYHMAPPGYGYHPMPPDASMPPPEGSRYAGPHPSHAHAPGMDPSASRMMHYPGGYMAPRHRLYRRFVTGPPGRRDGFGQYPEWGAQPGAPPAAEGGGLMSMASAPAGFVGGSGSQPTSGGRVPLSGAPSAATAPASCPPAPMHAGTGGVATSTQAPPEASSGEAAARRAAADPATAPSGQAGLQPQRRRSTKDSMDADMESTQAARACHEQFSSDDMPLPLPRSTVDGIRHELRIVTQELLQRRMDEARSHQQMQQQGHQVQAVSAGEAHHGYLRPANSWAPGDGPFSLSVRSAPTAAAAMAPHPHPVHPYHMQPRPQPCEAQAAPSETAPAPAAQHGLHFPGPSGPALPHKRSASAGPPASAGTSPVRPRPAPSAPTGHFGQMPTHGLEAPVSHAGDPSTRPGASFAAPAPVRPTQASSAPAPAPTPAGGPSAMRQLFPPPAGVSVNQTPPSMCGSGSGPSNPASVKPAPAATATAPGPRPAMSGKSAASATQSASVAQAAPAQAPRQQQQQQPRPTGSTAVPMGSYRVGQQGSMAAEAEDDGEEVHGPPQRSSNNRPAAGPAAASSAPCGPPPPSSLPPGGYYGSMPPPSYEYPHGYYYPPPAPGYGSRMYPGMPPPAGPGYRGGPSASMPMYSMPPPGGAYGVSQSPWPEYGMPPVAPSSGVVAGGAVAAPQIMKRSTSAAGAYPPPLAREQSGQVVHRT